MPIARSTRRVSAIRIAAIAERLLEASTLCAIATVSPSGRAYVHTAYFAWTLPFDLIWLSDADAVHSRYLRSDPTAAVAVYDSHQVWGEPDRGLQLFGTAQQLGPRSARGAQAVYAKRFRGFGETDLGGYRIYRLQPRRMKVFDERQLGPGVFVTARVGRGGHLAWERTDISRAQITSG